MGVVENLNLKVSETKDGNWFYAVYDGDGTRPGSLLSASSTTTIEKACVEGSKELERWLMIRECDHDWSGKKFAGIPQCVKCGIVDWKE